MRKGGAISLSFGMIFSIIMIIAILGVGFYAITFFLNMQNCTTTADFHKRFQQKIDNAWNAEIVSDEFYLDLPSKIKKVCFGDLENPGELRGNLVEIHEELRTFASMNQRENSNMFMYPAPSACKLGYKQVKNIILLSHLSLTQRLSHKKTFVSLFLEKEDVHINQKNSVQSTS